jgi:putative ABC transport system ATP-binding protein
MIELEGVSRVYEMGGQPVYALRDVDETIEAGDYVAIMGPSGSGKSTLLNVIGCLDRPTSGTYRLDGQDVGELSDVELSRIRGHKIGFVFQVFHLVPRLSAAENVAFPMLFAGIPRAERQARVAEALAAVGLADRADHRPAQLSGGERQRVAIARATIMKPHVLLADEPTGNLDSKAGRQVMALLEEMNAAGLTLLVVTHDPTVAARARRVLIMEDGAIVRRLRGSELATSGAIPAPAPGTPA